MNTNVVLLQLVVSSVVPGQVDSICRDKCEIIAVQAGVVKFINQWPPTRTLALGEYAPAAQHLVPKTEAPILDLRSKGGWRVVASPYLDHDQDDILMHVRFFGPGGKLQRTGEALLDLVQTRIGSLFGGSDEIFAITSNEEHDYNAQTEIWLLPRGGRPKSLLEIEGTYKAFIGEAPGQAPGVRISRQTYDGAHAETKGTVEEFWAWNAEKRSLIGPQK